MRMDNVEQASADKSWAKFMHINGHLIKFGFIDDTGHGDRHFVTIDDRSVDDLWACDVLALALKKLHELTPHLCDQNPCTHFAEEQDKK